MQRLEFETKALVVEEDGAIAGIAWPFGTPDRVGDMIMPGAFKSVAMPLPALYAHDPRDVVGVWESAVETSEGLEVKGRLLVDDVERAREVRSMVRAGAIRGLSVGFGIRKAAPRSGGGRTITDLDLREISLVSVPAHPRAQIRRVKSAAEAIALADAINRAAAAFRS